MTNIDIRSEKGLSLIEMAVGLIVLGLVAVPFFMQVRIEQERAEYRETRGALINIRNGINQHYTSGAGAYPCPASLVADEGDADFGISKPCLPVTNIPLCSDPTWNDPGNGVCRIDAPQQVFIGAVPFSTLRMKTGEALDSWGNKILYAVSYNQTNDLTFGLNAGTITALSVDDPLSPGADNTPDPLPLNYDFILLSYGRTAVGAYNKEGDLVSNCTNALEGTEFENCNMDGRFLLHVNPTNRRANARSNVSGPNFYDDITEAQQTLPEQTWFQHVDNSVYANNDFLVTLATRVGVGVQNPQERLHVGGTIRVEPGATTNGQIESDLVCSPNGLGGESCINPTLITEDPDSMSCADDPRPGDQVVMRLGNGRVYCNGNENNDSNVNSSTVEVSFTTINNADTVSCPGDQAFIGISATGDMTCAP